MNRERFKRMRELFRVALGLGIDERPVFPEEAYDGDEELHGDVERLFHIDQEADSFLETSLCHPQSSTPVISDFDGRDLRRLKLSSTPA
jgi:hypothetical protein